MITQSYIKLNRESNERLLQAWINRKRSVDPELIAQAEQTWLDTITHIEAQPVYYPGALFDCQAERLLALRSDVSAIEYTAIRTSFLAAAYTVHPPLTGVVTFDTSEAAHEYIRANWQVGR